MNIESMVKGASLHKQAVHPVIKAMTMAAPAAGEMWRQLLTAAASSIVAVGIPVGYMASKASSPTDTDIQNARRGYTDADLGARIREEALKLRDESVNQTPRVNRSIRALV